MVRRGCDNRSARGFSLVELLVVIGIIALLMGLLLPSVRRSLRQAAATVCMHNLKKVGQALEMYRLENAGFLPNSASEPIDPEDLPEALWFGKLFPKYLSEATVLACPDDAQKRLMHAGESLERHPDPANASSYGLSKFLLASTNQYLTNLDRRTPTRPLQTVLVADMGPDSSVAMADSGWPARDYGRLDWGDHLIVADVAPKPPWLTARHSGYVNALLMGGGVRRIRTQEMLGQYIQPYYDDCAAGHCTICLYMEEPHYSFAHADAFWWTGPVPQP